MATYFYILLMDSIVKNLKLLYQNVRGLRTKTNDFYNNVLLCSHDIIMVTETWLCNSILDSELCDSKYSIFRRDRGTLGGGVMLLCNSRLQARARPEWECDDLECVWATIPSHMVGSNGNLNIAVIYIPPDSMLPTRIQSFVNSISAINNDNSQDHFLIAGDFNLPGIDWGQDQPIVLKKGSVEVQNSANSLIAQTSFIGLSQYNRLVNSHNHTLDLVFSDFPVEIHKSTLTLVKEDSFHPTFFMNVRDILIPPFKSSPRIKYQFRKAHYDSINASLIEQDWSFVNFETDIELVVSQFYSILNDLISLHVPQVCCSGDRIYPIWYSKALINVIREKTKAHRNWKQHNNQNDYIDFSQLRLKQKYMQCECYHNFINFSQAKIKTHPKFFWTYVKSKRQNKSNYPQQMYFNDVAISDQKNICSAFNDFFQRNFRQPSSQYKASDTEISSHYNTIHSIQVTEQYVLKLIANVDATKGAGTDKIPPTFFINCANSLAVPIALIFNRCLRDGYFPKIWKQAHIVPVHKKGQKAFIENYRPISILNVLSKLLERVVHNHIYPIIAPLLPTEQHGFMKGRSTTTNLGVFIDSVIRGMDGGSQVDVVYTDFEKAFDRVDHMILLQKLYELGIRGNLLRWMESYLRNRSQAVVVGGFCSDFREICSGVPQGSILGPFLYTSYLYDIGRCFQHAKYLMYADDTKIYMQIKSQRDCMNLQSDLVRMGEYYSDNRIDINISKCQYISYTRKKKSIHFDYQITKVNLKKVDRVMDLGVMMDAKLSFSDHVQHISNKALKSLGFVLRVSRPFSDTGCLKLLYNSYVRSVLEYCSIIWNPQYITYKQIIERIQYKFIKHLNYRSYISSEDYEEACVYHKLSALDNRRVLADMAFLHGLCNGYIDCSDLLQRVMCICCPKKRTRHTSLFAIQRSSTYYAQNAVISRLQKTYNNKFNNTVDLFCYSRSKFKHEILGILNQSISSDLESR